MFTTSNSRSQKVLTALRSSIPKERLSSFPTAEFDSWCLKTMVKILMYTQLGVNNFIKC